MARITITLDTIRNLRIELRRSQRHDETWDDAELWAMYEISTPDGRHSISRARRIPLNAQRQTAVNGIWDDIGTYIDAQEQR